MQFFPFVLWNSLASNAVKPAKKWNSAECFSSAVSKETSCLSWAPADQQRSDLATRHQRERSRTTLQSQEQSRSSERSHRKTSRGPPRRDRTFDRPHQTRRTAGTEPNEERSGDIGRRLRVRLGNELKATYPASTRKDKSRGMTNARLKSSPNRRQGLLA